MPSLPEGLTIRPERSDDGAAIRAVLAAAFGSDVEADLVDRIRASPEYVAETALVAVVGDGTVVGHVMISHALIRNDEGERPISMLSPLAVLPAHQGRGIGSALVRAALAAADERGEPIVVLEGNPAFYGRLGFEHAEVHGIRLPLPTWAPSEAGQVVRLRSYHADAAALRGSVIYPVAFDGLG
jgi:putative acetyltransferase